MDARRLTRGLSLGPVTPGPTADERALLARWGWPEPDEQGRTADPSGGGTVHWTTALRWIARDEARGDRP